ncbi:MAG: nucleoside monophosphate kinase [Candidatus Vogelbacteria bacterium]|nr:nucleoside monophosphate kinase [Candidatus Vogelbacteria bacterium]
MDKSLQTYIFIGRSGCGKGTQAELLIAKLKEQGAISDQNPLLYIETGDKFRTFVSKTSHSSRLAKEVMNRSERQPDFLAVWMWSHILVESLMGDEQIIFDGTPRSLPEAQILDTAIKFYGRVKPAVIYLDVSNDWSTKRLVERGRDKVLDSNIAKRLAWFESDVLPAIKFYENNPDYNFVKVKGEQSIEEVQAEIMEKVGV